MTLAIPTVPRLPAGYIVQQADLNNIAQAVTFLTTKPIARVQSNALGTAISTSRIDIPWDTMLFDTDGMWNAGNPTRLTVNTPGWFKVRYAVSCTSTSTVTNFGVQSVSGASNPGGPGNVSAVYWGSDSVGATGGDHPAGGGGVWPFYLWAGDYLKVTGLGSGADAVTITAPFSFFSVEYISIALT